MAVYLGSRSLSACYCNRVAVVFELIAMGYLLLKYPPFTANQRVMPVIVLDHTKELFLIK